MSTSAPFAQKNIKPMTPLPASPWWMKGKSTTSGHIQTIWTALCSRHYKSPCLPLAYRRERWLTTDQDFIDIDWLKEPAKHPYPTSQPLMVLFHGLEGSSQSSYALALANWCASQGWAYAVVHFRSCSGEINRAPRIYHMSDYVEADWILKRMREQHRGSVIAVGVSLGANVLLRWAVESGQQALQTVCALASICAPLDLLANAKQMDKGFCKWVYTEMFLRTLRLKAEYKIKQYPGLFDIHAVRKSRTFAQFDAAITAPIHGFKDHIDYWTRCSITPTMLEQICVPSLILNTINDPFIPASSLPYTSTNAALTYLRPLTGGHLGFASGAFPGNLFGFSQTIGSYLKQQISL